MESRITDIQQESIIEDLISDSVLTELNRSENISDNSVNTVLSFSNSTSTNALSASSSTYSMIDPLLDNESGLQGSTIAELLKSSESPAMWALGIAILNNVLNTSTLEADIESVEFLQKTQKANSQRVIDQNNQILDQLNKLIKENGKAYRSGVNRQGEISPTPEPPSWRYC